MHICQKVCDEGGRNSSNIDVLKIALDGVRHMWVQIPDMPLTGFVTLSRWSIAHLDSLFIWTQSFQKSKTSWGVIRCPQVTERAHSLIWGSKCPWNKGIISTIRKKKRLRGSVLTCLRSHRGRDLNQRPFGHKIYSVRTILAHLHGDSYRTRSGHLARTSSIIHCFLPLSPLMPLNMVGKAQVILIMSALTKTYFYLL